MRKELKTREDLVLEVERLTAALEETAEMLKAICNGEVDALVVQAARREQVFTLRGADYAYRALVEAMNEGALTLLADGTILYANRSFAEMVRTPLQKVLGAAIRGFVAPADHAALTALLGQGSQSSGRGEMALRAADGTLIPVLVSINPVPMEGTEGALSVVVMDLTEQKRAAEALVADRRKDEFLAMLAHELRNPLAPILNAVQILRLRGLDDARLQRARDVVERQVKLMARLLDDLLEVSRITRGKLQLRVERVDLQTIVAHAVQTSRPLMEVRRHELSISMPEEAVWLEADPTRLEQVLVNLLNNATKYTDRGGRIGLTAERQGNEVVLQVRDTGKGIPPELLPHVFDLFVQSERSLDRSEGGLGIGLTLVKELVEMHGGAVTAHSDGPGRGSEFVVRLPIADAEWENPQFAIPNPQPEIRRRVLVVEDNLDAAETLAEVLELFGHEVRVAHDGPTGIAVAVAYQPEVVLLDLGLPVMDGYEVARALRQELGLEGICLVALTGYGGEEDRRRSREVGFDHHVLKPVDIAVVQALLARSHPAGT